MELTAVDFGAPQASTWHPWPELRLMPDDNPPPPKNPSTSSGYPVEGEEDVIPETHKNPSTDKGYSIPAS